MPTNLKDATTKTADKPLPKGKPLTKPAKQAPPPSDDDASGLMALMDGDDEPAEAAEAETSDDEQGADAQPIAKPENKAGLTKMTLPEIEQLLAQEKISVPNWAALSIKDKKAAASAALFPEKASAAGKMLLNDPLSQVQHDIEKMDDPDEIDATIQNLLKSEGINDFRLGGLLQRLSMTKTFEDGESFKGYVEEHYGVAYRKAMYLIKNYSTVMAAGISWGDVEDLGWTKLAKIIDVINADNVKEWVAKAKTVNNSTLKKLVKEALAAGGTDLSDVKVEKNFKTKTFAIPEDEVEAIDEALDSAMTMTKTDSKGVALIYICNEFLNSAGDKKATVSASNHKKVVDQLEDANALVTNLRAQIEELENKVANSGQASLRETFEFLKMQHGGVKAALAALFGAEFDEAFPNVDIDVDATKVVEPEEAPVAKPAKAGGGKKAAKKAA